MKLPCEWCDKDIGSDSCVYDEASGNYICEECADKADQHLVPHGHDSACDCYSCEPIGST